MHLNLSNNIQISFLFLFILILLSPTVFAINNDGCHDHLVNDIEYNLTTTDIIDLIKKSTEYQLHIIPREPLWQFPSVTYGGTIDEDNNCKLDKKISVSFQSIYINPNTQTTSLFILDSSTFEIIEFKIYNSFSVIHGNSQIVKLSPKIQHKYGVGLENILCNEDLVQIIKYTLEPACVTPETKIKLIERGWGLE